MISPARLPTTLFSVLASALTLRRHPLTVLVLLLYLLLAWLLYNGISGIEYQWRWGRIPRYFFIQRGGEWVPGVLTKGLLVTLQLSFLAGVAALGIGFLAASMRLLPLTAGRLIATGYVQFMRCTPLLVQLYLLYFMFGTVFGMPRFSAGVLALALFEGAFVAEIFRAGYLAVPQTQVDAACALGLKRFARWRLVIVPQALPLILPPLANLFVSIIKHSSIVTIIAIADLTDAARNVVAETFLAFEIWLSIGVVYVAICFPLAWLVRQWELHLRQKR